MRTFIAAVLLLLASCSTDANAAVMQIPTECAPRNVFVDNLFKEFGETQAWLAPTSDPRFVLEKYNNLKERTYTLFLTSADGESCLLFFGKDEQFFFPLDPNSNAIKD